MLLLRVRVDTPHSPKLQHYWSLTIRLFSVISRTIVGGILLLCRDAVGVFYSPSWLGRPPFGWAFSAPMTLSSVSGGTNSGAVTHMNIGVSVTIDSYSRNLYAYGWSASVSLRIFVCVFCVWSSVVVLYDISILSGYLMPECNTIFKRRLIGLDSGFFSPLERLPYQG